MRNTVRSTHERCPRCGRLLAPLNGKLPAHRVPPTRPYNRSSVPLTGRDAKWCAEGTTWGGIT